MKGVDATLAKGLAVLDALVRAQRECRVVEVAQAHGLARSNAHRTLKTLVACGWAVQNPQTSAYRPSLRLFELGALVEAATDVRLQVRPELAELARTSGETIHLTMLEGGEILYIDKFDSPLPVAAYSRVGGRAPAYCVASGKALLAALEPDRAALASRLGPLRPHTPRTRVDLDALLSELGQCRQRGWAVNHEEWRLGVCGLGAPIFDALGQAVAAVGMSVPALRFSRARQRELLPQLLACAARASAALGFQPLPAPPANRSRRRPS